MRVEQQQQVADYRRAPDNNRSSFGPDVTAVSKLGYEYEARVIDDESRKQEEYLDQIGRHLAVLKAGALVSSAQAYLCGAVCRWRVHEARMGAHW
jgi:hypothetical protein